MSHFVLDVTHIGEELVASLCNTPDGEAALKELLNKTAFQNFNFKKALPNRNIFVGNLRGDAKSQIDVALFCENENEKKCYAMELKLGKSLSTPSQYYEHFLGEGKKYTEKRYSFKGNMIPILARLNLKNNISVTEDNNNPENKTIVEKSWILMVRTDKIRDQLTTKNTFKDAQRAEIWKSTLKDCAIISLESFFKKLPNRVLSNHILSCIIPPNKETFDQAWFK